MDFDQELDVRGQVCPIPALKTKKNLQKMKKGQILKVIVDYEPAIESIPRDLARTMHKLLVIEEMDDDEGWELFFRCEK
ncbi:MAG: sulfurtransferase TusA family protein [Promethearchaeota archaeon]